MSVLVVKLELITHHECLLDSPAVTMLLLLNRVTGRNLKGIIIRLHILVPLMDGIHMKQSLCV